ncbi:unnamed protein product [Phytophthora fragariaefolia]|uniref:Unnamed protein product n=1 Tax=Phytophthora fragariaefolia TaxID=1490495 RepID=A0A9W6XJN6_9STRA|nr:unnamed protein product [Phytophthora fragariaefolia]
MACRSILYLILIRASQHVSGKKCLVFGTQLSMSTADHPQTDGQTERVNQVLVDALKSYAQSFHHWSVCMPMAFAINNSVHVSTGHTPFYVNALRHPRVLSVLGTVAPSLTEEGHPVLPKPNKHADMTNISAVSTRARTERSPINESTVSTPGVDISSNNEQHTQAGPVVNKDAGAERPDAGRSENGDGVRSPPPSKPPKGVKLEREL